MWVFTIYCLFLGSCWFFRLFFFIAMRETWFASAFNYEILLSCLIWFTGGFQKSVHSFVSFIYVN